MHQNPKKRSKSVFAAKAVALLSLSLVLILLLELKFNLFGSTYYKVTRSTQFSKHQELEFPQVDRTSLNSNQLKLIDVLEQEYKLGATSFDDTMRKYSQGAEEPWCADFVSWVYKESGMPLNNPNSGSWRIPGTQTLKQYFKNQGSWQEYVQNNLQNYQPKPGDVVIYKSSTSPFGRHTNIVLKNEDGLITTIGGNEGRKVRIQKFKLSDQVGVDGYGKMNNGN